MKKKIVGTLASLVVMLSAASIVPAKSAPVCIENSKVGQQLNLPIYEWVDNSKTRRGTIVAVPGLTLYAYSWNDMGKFLAARGYDVFSLDARGFGRWRTESARYGGTSKIEVGQSQQDLLDLVTNLRQLHPKQKLYCLGESVGSNMSMTLISEHPELADGVILGSPCYKTRMHAKPLHWAEDFAKTIVKPNRLINLEPYAAPYLTNDKALAQACDVDPLIYRKLTAAELIKIDVMNDKGIEALKKFPNNFPTLIIAGDKDAMFKSDDLPKFVEKLGLANVQLRMLPGKGHLLMEHQPVQPAIGGVIASWLLKNLYTGTNAATPPAPGAVTTSVSAQSTTVGTAHPVVKRTKFSGVYVAPSLNSGTAGGAPSGSALPSGTAASSGTSDGTAGGASLGASGGSSTTKSKSTAAH
jgi:alpha-beta hydrolase superfamily lysophospholipase